MNRQVKSQCNVLSPQCKNNKMEKKLKKQEIRMTEKCQFNLMKWENVERLSMALILSGYFVRVIYNGSSYLIFVYQ